MSSIVRPIIFIIVIIIIIISFIFLITLGSMYPEG